MTARAVVPAWDDDWEPWLQRTTEWRGAWARPAPLGAFIYGLPDEPSLDTGPVIAGDEEIVGLPPEPLGLEMNFRHRAVADDRWDRPDEEQREPMGTDMLL